MGHDIVSEQAGWPTFGWLLAAFLVATILFAPSLRFIIEQLRRLQKFVRGVLKLPQRRVQAASDGFQNLAYGQLLLHHTSHRSDEKDQDIENGSIRS